MADETRDNTTLLRLRADGSQAEGEIRSVADAAEELGTSARELAASLAAGSSAIDWTGQAASSFSALKAAILQAREELDALRSAPPPALDITGVRSRSSQIAAAEQALRVAVAQEQMAAEAEHAEREMSRLQDTMLALAKAEQASMDAAAELQARIAQLSPAGREVFDTFKGFGDTDAEALEQALRAQGKLGEATKIAKGQFRDLAQALGLVNPQLGFLTRALLDVREGLAFLMTPAGLKLAGLVGGIGAVAAAWQKVSDELEEATKQLQEFADAEERVRQRSRERERTTAGAAAAAGLAPNAVPVAMSVSEELRRAGIDQQTAESLAPYFVSPEGERLFSEEERLRAAAAVQAGIEQGPRGDTVRQRRQSAQRLVTRVTAGRSAADAQNAAAVLVEQRRRELEEAVGGSVGEVARIIAERTGLEGEDLQQRSETVARQFQSGPRVTQEAISAGIGHGTVIRREEQLDPLVPALRSELEQLRRRMDRLQNGGRIEVQVHLVGPAGAKHTVHQRVVPQ